MLFNTDRQTLDDLNIFGKHGGESVYNIFNRTTTRGGALLLEEMFRYPLSDEQAINRRSGIIQYFSNAGTVFPFKSVLFDAVEPYLANTDERTKLSKDDASLGRKLGNIIGMDVQTALIYKGVDAIMQLLEGVEAFLLSLPISPYDDEKAAITLLLQKMPAYKEGKLSHADIADYDIQFRFRHREEVHRLLRHLYLLDVYMAVSKVAAERKFVFPLALPREKPVVILDGVYHPHVKNAVGNTLRVTPDSNLIFLTGANMAGKSTFMKSLGIALFLAHMGFPVPAQRMEFSVLDGIYTTINLPDNLGMGASHFYAEVLRVKKMAQELSQSRRLFIVFDELFRGTNVQDAYEATIAIASAFAQKRNSLFVISTHIIEAGDVLKEKWDNISFKYLPTRMNGNTPMYTYTLETGITADRHGMVIINNEGILDILEKGKVKKMIAS
ncbi:DNA mismatch repair protein [Flavitalea sp. BT771]|uniref:MutS-related protein n=1 Tax=Flavitalea sp. BT771 TaxID=3063329 RepID=UPI0026E38351|nr:DNA mismatch repair protein [Flavitalea sp. BT771]MDO6432350.1 DNA mismatch repair protein [Flavitalea sp. BT771]MDV6221260.1 DNA mismatch repair protein [Flavitalea sp. BT771]